jgi:hypothetical protein
MGHGPVRGAVAAGRARSHSHRMNDGCIFKTNPEVIRIAVMMFERFLRSAAFPGLRQVCTQSHDPN